MSISKSTSSTSEDEASHLLVTELAPKIDELRDRWQSGSFPAESGSRLAGDDRHSKPFQLSHAAWQCLVHSIDNLHGLRVLTVRGEDPHFTVFTHPYAQYPMLRAALENASAAIWLLAPDSRVERLTRRFRLLYADAANRDFATELIGKAEDLKGRRLARIEPSLLALGISKRRVKDKPGFMEIVREAGAHIGDPVAPLFFWRLLSGMTHGDMWASHTATDRDEVYVAPDGDTVTVKTTSSITNIAGLTKIALNTTLIGLALYDRQRLSQVGFIPPGPHEAASPLADAAIFGRFRPTALK